MMSKGLGHSEIL